MNPDELASAAILITLWDAQEGRAAGAGREAARAEIRPICDMVTDIVGQGDDPAALREALRWAASDDHARATLQRHVAGTLQAEPALVSELLRRLLEIGEVCAADGVTRIEISLPSADADSRTGTRIWVSLPWAGGGPPRPTPPPPSYVGHGREIEQVLTAVESADRSVRVVAVTGPAGQGKTAFARVVADRLYQGKAARVQLELSLSRPDLSFPGGMVPRAPGDALFEALLALGVPASDVPADLAQRAALYRVRLSDALRPLGTRPLILLDDARDLDQVQYFRPSGPGVILVTGDYLDGTHASVFALEALSAQESFELLASRMDPDQAGLERTPENLAALQRLVQLCAGVPLAVAIMAGVLAASTARGETPAALAEEMQRAYRKPAVTPPLAALALSYPRLTMEQRHVLHVFALLGLPALDLNLIAAASGLSRPTARIVVDQLVRRSLVEPFGSGDDHWRLHRVVFGYISQFLPERVMADRERILSEAARVYLRRSRGLADLLGAPAAASDPAIVAWAEEQVQASHTALLALLRAALGAGLTQVAQLLAASVVKMSELVGDWPELDRSMQAVIVTARSTAAPGLEASALEVLARQSERRGQHQSAADLRDRARTITRQAGSSSGRPAGHTDEGPAGEPAARPAEHETLQGTPSAGNPGDTSPGPRRPAPGPRQPGANGTGEPAEDADKPGANQHGESPEATTGPQGPGDDRTPPSQGPENPPGGPSGGGSSGGGPSGGGPSGGGSSGGGSSPAAVGVGVAGIRTAISQARGGTAPTTPTTFGTGRREP